VPLVIVEGNYLLLEDGPWAGVRPLLDACWYIELDAAVRLDRLIARHVAHGRTPEAALEWVQRNDEINAALIATTRGRADRCLRL
jgi:pantothenate kinase